MEVKWGGVRIALTDASPNALEPKGGEKECARGARDKRKKSQTMQYTLKLACLSPLLEKNRALVEENSARVEGMRELTAMYVVCMKTNDF